MLLPGLEVVGPLGDGRPAVPQEGVRRRRRRSRRSRTPRATSPRSSSRPSRRSRTAPRCCCSSTSTPAPARRSRPTRSRSGVKVIDYDRLTLNGDSDYYVSFDNEKVGKLQGQGLVDCLRQDATASRSPSSTARRPTTTRRCSRRATTRSCDPLYNDGKLKKVADQSVPDWDNQKALTIFEQMLQKTDNKIDGVLAANDGLGNAAISALKQRKLDADPGHRPGRDAAGRPEHRHGRPVHDGLQGDQEGGRRGRQARDRACSRARRPDATGHGQQRQRRTCPRSCSSAGRGHQGQHQGLPRRARLPQEGGDLRRQGRRDVHGGRAL